MSWAPCKISSKKAILASHPELTARFLKETSKGKKELYPEIDHMDLIVRQETLPMVAGHPVMLQLCTVPAYALTLDAKITAFCYFGLIMRSPCVLGSVSACFA